MSASQSASANFADASVNMLPEPLPANTEISGDPMIETGNEMMRLYVPTGNQPKNQGGPMPDTPASISPLKTVAVAVEPATASKINRTQIISGVAMLLSFMSGGKLGMTHEQQTAVAVVIGLLTNVVTVIFKTFYTRSVTPASVANANTTTTIPAKAPIVHIT